jgi:hypothetical protein
MSLIKKFKKKSHIYELMNRGSSFFHNFMEVQIEFRLRIDKIY